MTYLIYAISKHHEDTPMYYCAHLRGLTFAKHLATRYTNLIDVPLRLVKNQFRSDLHPDLSFQIEEEPCSNQSATNADKP